MLSEADLLEWTLSERKNINREWASLFITHTLTLWGHEWERRRSLKRERERTVVGDHLLCLWVLLLPLVLILSLRKLHGFLLYGFPEENLCLLSLVIIVVHIILSYKILISYWLNDKNLTLPSNTRLSWTSKLTFLIHWDPFCFIYIARVLWWI